MPLFLFPPNQSFVDQKIISDLKTGGQWRMTSKTLQKNAWVITTHKPFHVRTTNLARTLKRWYKKKKPIQQQLDVIQDQINNIQLQPLNMQDHSMEANLIAQYEETMTKLTEFYRQRAKKHWATQGDRNTSYFHHAVFKRKRRNPIVAVKDVNDNILHDPDDIATEFVNYFQTIFRTSSTNNNMSIPNSTHPEESQDFTNSIPDKQEIWEILKAMKKNASSGPDGFNVVFYLAACSWIGDDVTALIRNFYITGTLPSHLNDTHIALIPQKMTCLLPSDYRPISLCNVIYKLIAKSLANRLKDHLPDYIHPS